MRRFFRKFAIKVDNFLTRRMKPRGGGKAGRLLVEKIFPNREISVYIIEKFPTGEPGKVHTLVNVDEEEWYNLDDETQRKAAEIAAKYNAEIRTRWSLQ